MADKLNEDQSLGDVIESIVDVMSSGIEIENLDQLVSEGLVGRGAVTRRLMDEPEERPVKSRIRKRRVRGRKSRGSKDSPVGRSARRLRGRPSRLRGASLEPGMGQGGVGSARRSKGRLGGDTTSSEPSGPTLGGSRSRIRRRPNRGAGRREGESPLARYGTLPVRYGESIVGIQHPSDMIEMSIDDIVGDEGQWPEEDHIVTDDHLTFYQHGKQVISFEKTGRDIDEGMYVVLETGVEFEDMWDAINAHMEATSYFPNVWFISDHGNAHLMIDPSMKESDKDKKKGEKDKKDKKDKKDVKEAHPGEDLYIGIYARVHDDGYLLYAAYEDDYTGSDNYWPDYYSSDIDSDELETVHVVVPEDVARDAVEQGGSGQIFGDGYEAWQTILSTMRVDEAKEFE